QFAAVAADPAVLAGLEARKAAEGGAEWLFVSRLLPHKGQHELVKALAAYRLAFDPAARLTLIGAVGSARYAAALADFVADLGLRDAVTVSGSVPPSHLAAHFQAADVYVSASAHEGFGVPLVEAMAHDVPIVAYATTAVPETVDGAGVLVGECDPETLAAAVHRVVTDAGLQRALVAYGRRRLAELALPASEQKLRRALSEVLTSAGLAPG
ncbi:MAG TPA: glycosyltransferase, partial [Acidimicrobiales bacterium]|nr:glycosyltransferase [Acidimicrobiales bacterium]